MCFPVLVRKIFRSGLNMQLYSCRMVTGTRFRLPSLRTLCGRVREAGWLRAPGHHDARPLALAHLHQPLLQLRQHLRGEARLVWSVVSD